MTRRERKPGHVPECQPMIACVCTIVRTHPDAKCRFRVSATCAVPIECDDHGHEVCPKCDPCTCEFEAVAYRPGPDRRDAAAWAYTADGALLGSHVSSTRSFAMQDLASVLGNRRTLWVFEPDELRRLVTLGRLRLALDSVSPGGIS